MNERFVYHASLGFCIAVARLLTGLLTRNKIAKMMSYMTFGVLIIIFSFITIIRLPDWRNNDTLLRASLKYSPNSAKANCFFAMSIWNDYTKLPSTTDTTRRYAMLDSMRYYFEKSVDILPSFNIPQTMRAYVAAEYHKLNKNYDDLLYAFENINRSGVVEPFVINYMKKINSAVSTKSDAEKLLTFYSRMIEYYKGFPSTAGLIQQYKDLSNEIQSKMSSLN